MHPRGTGAEGSATANWKRFLAAAIGLAAAFFLALDATAFSQQGRFRVAAALAGLSLVLAGLAAVAVIPDLVRKSVLSRWAFRTQYELTREGLVYFAIILLISVASLNTGNNLLFMILTILLAGILMSGVCSKTVLAGLELEMRLPEHVFAGQPTPAHLRLTNTKRYFPTYSVTVSSKTRKQREGKRTRQETASPSLSNVLSQPVYAPYIPRRSVVVQQVMLNFPRRGRYGQDIFGVSSKFPFGILRRSRALPSRCEILALPSIQPVQEIASKLPRLTAEIEGMRKGRGDDLYALRDYREGDSARHVNWKATAKSQSLKVREFTEQEENRLTFIFDARVPSLDDQTLEKFEQVVSLCACLAWKFFEMGSFLQFLSDGLKTSLAPAGEIIYPLLEALATIEPRAGSHAGYVFQDADRLPEGLPVIFTAAAGNMNRAAISEGACVITPDFWRESTV
ncbi:MAG TPA: DUF58 domain-containing protein [Terriglobia bacterium]|nr:DUF58 domain-containing protein [Terriglobia bacterium]